MIVRIFEVTARPGLEEAFRGFLLGEAVPLMHRTPGIVSVTAGTPRPETPRTFCLVMVWENLEALKAFTGEDYREPHVLPEEAEMVESRRISHFELVS